MPTLLKTMSVAFRKLATTVNQGREIEVKPFIEACSTINSLMSHLHSGPRSVVGDLNEEVSAIKNASRSYTTLNSMLEADIEQDNVLNLREDDNSLVGQGYRAYSMVFGEHLGDSFRTNIAKFLHLIPSKAEFLKGLQENETSCAANMRAIVDAAPRITAYIDGLM
ncbi:hypothetical protein MKW92_044888 [Papaver armeniacum]|nr:hypothetical protein MKW92_044888 [Papaver armeniacum]